MFRKRSYVAGMTIITKVDARDLAKPMMKKQGRLYVEAGVVYSAGLPRPSLDFISAAATVKMANGRICFSAN